MSGEKSMERSVHEEYVENLIDSMLHNMDEQSSNVLLIEHYNTLDLTYEQVMEISAEKTNVKFLYHSYETGDIIAAFEPFLDWIKELFYELSDESLEEFFENAGVYILHRPIFKSYFETGVCIRKEEVLINEIDFELEKFYKEICRMLERLSQKKPLMLVLNRIHYAGNSTINLIDELLSGLYGGKIAVLATYNDLFGVVEYCQNDWNRMVSKLESSDSIVEWVFNTTIDIRETKGPLDFEHDKMSSYIDKFKNLCDLLAFKQADYYLEIIYHKIEVEKINVAVEDKFNIFRIYAYVAMNLDKSSDALMYCDGMRFILEEHYDDKRNLMYNYLKAQICINSTQKENANGYVNRCRELSEKIGEKFLIFKVKILALMNEFSGWRNLWLLMEDKYVEPEFIEECEAYEYYNHLAHIYVYAFDNAPEKYKDVETVEKNIDNYNKGIAIAHRIGNDRFLIDAYKKSVMTASSNGFFDVSNYFYSQCYKVVSRIGNEFEEANIYNGMGYNCSTMEKYSKASEYFNKALNIFIKFNDVNYICETLYNMAINGILAEEYACADQYLNICLKACRLIKSDGIRVCNLSKLYGLRALCNYEMNVLYSCKINYQYLTRYLGHMIELEDQDEEGSRLWEDDMILYHLIGAVLLEKEKNYEKAYEHLCKAEKYMKMASGSAFLFVVPYVIAYSNVCKQLGKDEDAVKVLQKALQFCIDKGYINKKNKIKSYMEGVKYVPRKCDISIKGVALDEIIELVTSNIIRNDYVIQKDKIEFVSIWQKLIGNNEDSLEKVIRNSIATLKNTFSIDEFVFVRIENGKPVIKYNDSKYVIADKIEYLMEYFENHRNAFCTTRLDKEYVDHKPLIDEVFGVNTINTWMFAPIYEDEQMQGLFIVCTAMCSDWNHRIKRNAFVDSDVGIMLLMFRQLMDAIERMENRERIEKINNELHIANERLQNLAVRDMLTGLYNRQGFAEELESLIHMVEVEKKRAEMSILYSDLDNFKPYNDEFGHDIGDLVLIEYANLLKEVCGPDGYVVRYGGDEFLVIIPSVDREVVEGAAKKIFEILREERGFTDKVSKKLGRTVDIPEEKYLSCSIGISGVVLNPEDSARDKISDTIKRADEMMYYIKKTVKHRYVFYEDVQDKLEE